jgi:hypothetical protein
MDTDFAISCPLVRRRRPQIQFLSIGPYLCSTLPLDRLTVVPMRFATLHLHQDVKRTRTSKLSIMLDVPTKTGTNPGARGLISLHYFITSYFPVAVAGLAADGA